MTKKTIKQLANDREEFVRVAEKNKSGKIFEYIATMYSDPLHFVYELLQNADDAGADNIKILLNCNQFQFTHNGEKLFDIDDIDGITNYEESKKPEDIGKIGKFGIGFKSVFSVSDSPEIRSDEFHFKIENYIIPREISVPRKTTETVFTLPFNEFGKSHFQNIADKLKSIEAESMLFLNKIRRIEWQIAWQAEEEKGIYELSRKNGGECCLVSESGQGKETKKFLLFSENTADGKNKVAAAFKMDGGKIAPVDTKLFVFLPMAKEHPGLKFIVHAPYKTSLNREILNYEDKDNNEMTDQLAMLVAESIIKIKDKGLFNVDFMENILPIQNPNGNQIYDTVYKEVKAKLSKEAILPAADGSLVKAEDVLLTRSRKLIDLIQSAEDIASLFEGKKYWINSSIKENSLLGEYLKGKLGIPAKDMTDFSHAINEAFIAGKDDDWLVNFYSVVDGLNALYLPHYPEPILLDRPIIRLENKKHVKPKDGDGIYLPPSGDMKYQSEFNVVKKSIAKEERAKKFLEALRIKELDKVAEIKEKIAPNYKMRLNSTPENKEKHMQDFKKVCEIWGDFASEKSFQKQSEIIDIIKKIYFILGVNCKGEEKFMKPDDVYSETDDTKMWFAGNSEAFFLTESMAKEEYKKFMLRLGVEGKVNIDRGKSDTLPTCYAAQGWVGNPCFEDANIFGMEYAINKIDLERSTYLWDLLIDSPYTLLSQYWYNCPARTYGKIKSGILLKLEGKHWLCDKKGDILKKPISEISPDHLHDNYNLQDSRVEKLTKDLGMKPDDAKKYEEDHPGEKVVDEQEYEKNKEDAEKWREYQRQMAERKESGDGAYPNSGGNGGQLGNTAVVKEERPPWNPPCPDPDEAVIGDIETPDELSEVEKNDNGENSSGSSGTVDKTPNSDDDKSGHKKEIGRWGEKYANRILCKEYSEPKYEISWLNQERESGASYDFKIKDKTEDRVYYYEIKSRSKEKPREFDVSDGEWKCAEKYEDNYIIWLISGAGTETPRRMEFRNPVRMWKDKEIQAQPVRLKFKWRPDE